MEIEGIHTHISKINWWVAQEVGFGQDMRHVTTV